MAATVTPKSQYPPLTRVSLFIVSVYQRHLRQLAAGNRFRLRLIAKGRDQRLRIRILGIGTVDSPLRQPVLLQCLKKYAGLTHTRRPFDPNHPVSYWMSNKLSYTFDNFLTGIIRLISISKVRISREHIDREETGQTFSQFREYDHPDVTRDPARDLVTIDDLAFFNRNILFPAKLL